MLRSHTSWLLAALVFLISGCATAGAPANSKAVPITNFKMIAGNWQGDGRALSGEPFPATLQISDNGTLQFNSRSSRFDAQLALLPDGKVRWQSSAGTGGTMSLFDEGTKWMLRPVRDDGSFAGEYHREK